MSEPHEVRDLDVGVFGTVELGALIQALERHAQCAFEWQGKREPVDLRFDFCWFVPGELHSYRGSYDQLAITPKGPMETSHEAVKVSDFLARLKAAIGQEFTGWKGGEYEMRESTPVWVDVPRNCSGTAIVGIRCDEYSVILRTAHVDV